MQHDFIVFKLCEAKLSKFNFISGLVRTNEIIKNITFFCLLLSKKFGNIRMKIFSTFPKMILYFLHNFIHNNLLEGESILRTGTCKARVLLSQLALTHRIIQNICFKPLFCFMNVKFPNNKFIFCVRIRGTPAPTVNMATILRGMEPWWLFCSFPSYFSLIFLIMDVHGTLKQGDHFSTAKKIISRDYNGEII